MDKYVIIKERPSSCKEGIELLIESSKEVVSIETYSLTSSGKVNYGSKAIKNTLDEICIKEQEATSIILLTDKHRKLFEKYGNLEIRKRITAQDIPVLLKRFEGRYQQDNKYITVKYGTTLEELKKVISEEGLISFDFETTGLDVFGDDYPTMLQFSIKAGHSYVIPIREHFGNDFMPKKEVFDFIAWYMSDPNIEKIAHNIDFEFQVCAVNGVTEWKGIFHDTMLQSHLIDERTGNGLKDLVRRFIPEWSGYDDALGKNFATADVDTLSKYGALDSDLTLRLHYYFQNLLIEDIQLYQNYRNIVMPSRVALSKATITGLPINIKFLKDRIKAGEKYLEELGSRLTSNPVVKRFERYKKEQLKNEQLADIAEKKKKHKEGSKWHTTYTNRERELLSGETIPEYDFSISSNDQVAEILYHPKGFNYKKVEDSRGNLKENSDKYVLYSIGTKWCKDLLDWRAVDKMLGTYYKGLVKLSDTNNRIHGKFKSHGTRTGRLSSSDPNLQNMPSRNTMISDEPLEYVKGLKKAIVTPDKNWIFSQADYSQAELRMAAIFSEDPTMLKAYADGKDLHALTGAQLAGMDIDEFYDSPDFKDYRQKAKSANFGIIYDISPQGYIDYVYNQTLVKISKAEAENTINTFFNTYKRLKLWHRKYSELVKKNGYVRTLFGRKRRLDHLLVRDEYSVSQAERLAINSPIQGSAGEWALFSIACLDKVLDSKTAVFVNTVHDSVFHFIREDNFTLNISLVKSISESPPIKSYFGLPKLPITMKIDFEFSQGSWADMEEYEDLSKAVKDFQK